MSSVDVPNKLAGKCVMQQEVRKYLQTDLCFGRVICRNIKIFNITTRLPDEDHELDI